MTLLGKYILDGIGEPVRCNDWTEWAAWYGKHDRHVDTTTIGDVLISTVFLGTDHAFEGGPPVLWETMVFGGEYDDEQERYTSRADAMAGHARWVNVVKSSIELEESEPKEES